MMDGEERTEVARDAEAHAGKWKIYEGKKGDVRWENHSDWQRESEF
jgi:hypothetical protein